MTRPENKALLPAGLRDLLPPDAAHAARVVERLHASFDRHGYERVIPPLMEFEESLLDGAGGPMSAETFRLMDPVSQRMMGLRADITLQVARIATTRLENAPRPLRLSYSGDVLRVRGKQLRPERQFTQIGAELIGSDSPEADIEVILVAVEALEALGVRRLSLDLSLPPLVPSLFEALDVEGRTLDRLRAALDRKDAAAVEAGAAAIGPRGAIFVDLLRTAGPASEMLPVLAGLDLPDRARTEVERLQAVALAVAAEVPGLAITVDPVENRGFEYHCGVSFTLFARGVRGEIGNGGRYVAGADRVEGSTEPATGFTVYLDTILRALPVPVAPKRLYLPRGTSRAEAARFRTEGWIAIDALDFAGETASETEDGARRLGCTHILSNGVPTPLDTPK